MKLRRPRSVWIVLAALVLLAFVLRPGANGLRKRIVNSVSLALGRKVDVDWVKLRLLPQPGFDLENFVVYDDPAMNAEPILRAQEVTADLRLRSLLRGRLEIGRLSLKEPSFNLVRGQNGHWNVESLLERAAHANAAPTRNTLPERRPRFPYIEAENGRINFKIGAEKKSYALTDADLGLWLESDKEWGMRLAAQPVRTDYNLSDTGVLHVSGTWQTSHALRDTPMKFDLDWDGAQLGQLTKLLYGSDKGWRGGLSISAVLTGSPADLLVQVKTSVGDFRRYDVVSDDSLRLSSDCHARYSSVKRALSNIVCRSPIGRGILLVEGRIGAPTGPRSYDLQVSAQAVPLQALVALGHRVNENLPEDLTAAGTIVGKFAIQSSQDRAFQFTGSGQTQDLVLHSSQLKTDLPLGTVPFTLDSPDLEPRLDWGPARISLARSAYATLQASATSSRYEVTLQGDAQLQHLLNAAQIVGVHTPHFSADGNAKVNLRIASEWSAAAPPQVTGSAQLRSVRADLRSVSTPITIENATVLLDQADIKVHNLTASAAGTRWSGSLSYERPCKTLAACALHFDLRADTLSSDEVRSWADPNARKRPWYRLRDSRPSLLAILHADGQLAADRVQIRSLLATRVSAKVSLQDGQIQFSNLTGDFLGGKHRGDWRADLLASPPTIKATGALEHISLDQLALVMHDGWVSGTAKGTYEVSGPAGSFQDFLASADGVLRFEMSDGSMSHIVIPAATAPLRVRRFRGHLTLHSGTFEFQNARLHDGAEAYQVTGTASPGQKLDIRLVRSGTAFVVNGTLSQPRVVPAPPVDTQAALKP